MREFFALVTDKGWDFSQGLDELSIIRSPLPGLPKAVCYYSINADHLVTIVKAESSDEALECRQRFYEQILGSWEPIEPDIAYITRVAGYELLSQLSFVTIAFLMINGKTLISPAYIPELEEDEAMSLLAYAVKVALTQKIPAIVSGNN